MSKTFRKIQRSMLSATGEHTPTWKMHLEDVWFSIAGVVIDKPLGFLENVKRLFKWLPVIWKTKEFDCGFLFRLMEFQLQGMEKYMEDNGHHVGSDKTAHSIKIARVLLKRLNNNEHLENSLIPINRKYGKWEFDFDRPNLHKKFERDLTKQQKIDFEKGCMKAYLHSDYMEKQDIEYLFNHIKKYHDKWWD